MKKVFFTSVIWCFLIQMSFSQSNPYTIDSTICFQFVPEAGGLLPSTREVTLESNLAGNIVRKRNDIYNTDTGTWLPQIMTISTFENEESLILSLTQEWNETTQMFEDQTQRIYTLNGQGQTTQVITQTWDGNIWMNTNKEIYEYDSGVMAGPTLFLFQNWTDGDWLNSFQVFNSYNAQNLLASTFFQTWVNNAWLNGNRTFETYNAANLLVESKRDFWNQDIADWVLSSQVLYTYEGQDNTEVLSQQWDGFNEVWINSTLNISMFNSNHQKIEELSQVWIIDTWTNLFKSRFQYDLAGNLTRSEGDLFTEGDWRAQNACDLYWSLLPTAIFETVENQIQCHFPNPFQASSSFSCESLTIGKNYELAVFDVNGIQHFSKKIDETNDISINKNLPHGMYILVVKNEDGLVFRQKVIAQ